MSLIDICYEPLYKHFSYAKFGDFKIIVDTRTGCFNASNLCVSGGKEYKNWLQNKSSKEYIQFLKNRFDEQIIYEHKGGRTEMDLLVRGTYVSKHLLTHVARWISPEFAYHVNEIIMNYFYEEFKGKCNRNEIQVKDMTETHEKMEVDSVPDPKNAHLFVLCHTNGPYPYYAIRCCRKSKTTQIKKLRITYPDLTEIFEITYDPVAINLFKTVKKKLIKKITTFCNGIKLLDGYTVEEFESDVKKVAEDFKKY